MKKNLFTILIITLMIGLAEELSAQTIHMVDENKSWANLYCGLETTLKSHWQLPIWTF